MNIFSSLVASAYSGLAPFFGAAVATCTVNGQEVECPEWLGSVFTGFWLFYFVFIILIIVAQWKIFQKAGKPGWACLIPIYNIIVLLEIIKKPVWWIFLFFVPFVNIIIGIVMVYNLSKAFGKGTGFTLGILFLPFIFLPILGFGKSVYAQPA